MKNPHEFRPLGELDHQETVEFRLISGKIVFGRMIRGIVTPASRTYYSFEGRTWQLTSASMITGWREQLESDTVAEWRRHNEREAA